jgi:hypothetical protein
MGEFINYFYWTIDNANFWISKSRFENKTYFFLYDVNPDPQFENLK